MEQQPYLAESLAQRAAQGSIQAGDFALAGKAFFILGYIYDEQNMILTATLRYLEALHYFDLAGSEPAETISVLKNLGRLYRIAGRHNESVASYDRAMSLQPPKDELAGLLYNKGFAFYSVRLYDSAMVYFQKSYTLSMELGDYNRVGNNLNYIGLSLHYTGNQAQAREYFQKILNGEDLLGDKYQRKAAQSLHNIALTELADGDSAQAVETFGKALLMKEELGDSASLFNTCLDAGKLYMELGATPYAIELLTKAEQLYPSVVPDPEHFKVYDLLEKAFMYGDVEKRNYYSEKLNEAWQKHWDLHAQLSTENLKYQVERLEEDFRKSMVMTEQKKKQEILLAIALPSALVIALLCFLIWRRRLRNRMRTRVMEAFGE